MLEDDDAAARTLESLWQHDLKRLSDEELLTERDSCTRELEFPERGDSMISPESWTGIYKGRIGWLDREIARRGRLRARDTGFTPAYVEDVKAAIDLSYFITERAPSTRLKRYGGGTGCLGFCPWHDDTHRSLGVWERPEWHWYCFTCLEGGDVFNWLLKSEAHGFRQAVLLAADYAGIPHPHRGNKW